MDIKSLLDTLSQNPENKVALQVLLSQINIDYDKMCELLTKETGINWKSTAIIGQYYVPEYRSYASRYGKAIVSEKHKLYDKIEKRYIDCPCITPGKIYPTQKETDKLHFNYNEKVTADENFILCEYGLILSSRERYILQKDINEHNWTIDYLSLNGYINKPIKLTTLNSPKTVDLIKTTLNNHIKSQYLKEEITSQNNSNNILTENYDALNSWRESVGIANSQGKIPHYAGDSEYDPTVEAIKAHLRNQNEQELNK